MKTALAIVCIVTCSLSALPASPSIADQYRKMTTDTRTEAQKLLQSRGGAITNPVPRNPSSGFPPDVREVEGVRYHVEKLREWFVTKRGPQPLPAWDLVEGTVSFVEKDVVLVQRRSEFNRNQVHYQPVAVRNWAGTPKVGQLCAFYAMEMKEPHMGSDGQPVVLFDCGRLISATSSAKR